MQPYQRTREKREKTAAVTGILATLVLHALALVVCLTSGFTYLDPPPPERAPLVISFEEDMAVEKPVATTVGQEPQAEEVDLEKEVELVQQAESPHVTTTPNVTPATKPDTHGDVEVPTPEPPKEPELDPRASFPGMGKKDNSATTPHGAAEAGEGFKAGQPDGNAKEGSANAHLKGRNVLGTLPKPEYAIQAEGKVVVTIKVDQYGNVTEAIPGAEGTTITEKTLWNAARNAAMKAHFNMAADAPALQTGTITYIFKLK